jgi:hypothetical protein
LAGLAPSAPGNGGSLRGGGLISAERRGGGARRDASSAGRAVRTSHGTNTLVSCCHASPVLAHLRIVGALTPEPLTDPTQPSALRSAPTCSERLLEVGRRQRLRRGRLLAREGPCPRRRARTVRLQLRRGPQASGSSRHPDRRLQADPSADLVQPPPKRGHGRLWHRPCRGRSNGSGAAASTRPKR